MLNRVKGKRVAIGALGVALAAMLAVGVALGVGQRGDGPPTTWVTGVIDGEDIDFGEPFGPGRYAVPLDDWADWFSEGEGHVGSGKALVFGVPVGLRLTARVEVAYECWDLPCPGPALWVEGEEFWFRLDLRTAEERGRGYPFGRSIGEPIDAYGYPLRCGGREGCRASDDRPAKYDPLIDQVVASARIESAR